MKHRCAAYTFAEQMRAEGKPELASESAGCLKEWDVPDGEMPDTFLCEPLCPPCYADFKETLAVLRGKGVTLTVTHGGNK